MEEAEESILGICEPVCVQAPGLVVARPPGTCHYVTTKATRHALITRFHTPPYNELRPVSVRR